MHKIRTMIIDSIAAMSLAFALVFTSCTPAPFPDAPANDAEPPSIEAAASPETRQPAAISPSPTPILDLESITRANASRISEVGAIPPNQPASYHLSADGSTLAIGDAGGIRVLDAATGVLLSEIPLAVPDCAFGMGRPFRLNADGSFIAAVSETSVQVWQVGGGRIYEEPYSRRYASNSELCGADLPQLALSPDGMTLAISEVELDRTSARQVFRIIDIPTNTLLSEWVVRGRGPQGRLYGYPALGFSMDGAVLMTFTPARLHISIDESLNPFRFWATDTWEELEAGDPSVEAAFSAGDLLYTQSGDNLLQILSRTDGSQQVALAGVPCRADNPCPTIFSPNGKFLALLDFSANTQAYKRQVFATRLHVWDIEKRKRIAEHEGLWHDLEGIALSNSGKLIPSPTGALVYLKKEGWWTYPDYFDGLRADRSGDISFVPTSIQLFSKNGCTACGTCTLDLESYEATCIPGLANADLHAGWLSITYLDGRVSIMREDASGQAEVVGMLPMVEPEDTVHLLAYHEQYDTAFYCLEVDLRQQTCQIADLSNGDIFANQDDIHQLRFSPDGQYAAFMDRSINAAFLVDMANGKLTRMKPYQARALPMGVAFSPDGSRMAYLVQSTAETSRYYLEWVETASGKVLQRFDLRKLDMAVPVSLVANPDESLWALADAGGQILLLDTKNAALLHAWQAHDGSILSLAFSQGAEHLVSMDRRGWLRLWGVEK